MREKDPYPVKHKFIISYLLIIFSLSVLHKIMHITTTIMADAIKPNTIIHYFYLPIFIKFVILYLN